MPEVGRQQRHPGRDVPPSRHQSSSGHGKPCLSRALAGDRREVNGQRSTSLVNTPEPAAQSVFGLARRRKADVAVRGQSRSRWA
jgi:hypothetical protein